MSHISTKKSNSTNSNIQDCQDLVNGLENGSFSNQIDDNKKLGNFEEQKSINIEAKKFKEDESNPSFDLISKNQTLPKKIIKSITMKKTRNVEDKTNSQIKNSKFVSDSIEVGFKELSNNKTQHNTCTGLSGETTQITRIKSESQKSNSSHMDKMLGINIVKNYSFTHDAEKNINQKDKNTHNILKNSLTPKTKQIKKFQGLERKLTHESGSEKKKSVSNKINNLDYLIHKEKIKKLDITQCTNTHKEIEKKKQNCIEKNEIDKLKNFE